MRLPPQEIEAEESVLASILINDKSFKDCHDLKPEDFYKKDHQDAFRVMKRLSSQKERIDLVTVGSVLLKSEKLDLIKYLTSMTDQVPIASKLKTHAKIIKSASVKRKMLNSLSAINEKIYTDSLENLLDFAQSEIMGFKVSSDQGEIHHIKDIVQAQVDHIEHKQTHKNSGGIKTGFRSLDKYLDLNGAIYAIIAGRPSMGKTAFALTMIRNMAMAGGKPGVLTLEMGRGRLVNRWLAMLTGINTMNFNRYGALDNKDWQSLKDAAGEIYDLWDVLISDAPARSIEAVERQSRQMVADGVTAIFIDQLNQIGGLTDDDVKNFTKHSHRISQLGKELNVPIFLLAQLNRKLEDRSDKEPKLSDLKMSGSLEEDPDVVFLLYRPEYYEKTKEDKKKVARDVVVNIAKNRDGMVYREQDVIVFDKGRTLFEEDFSRIEKYI